MTTPEYKAVLTEDQVRQIIARAVTVEKEIGSITPQDLVGIAAEAGISQHALAVAMNDVLGTTEPAAESRTDPEVRVSWRTRGLRLLRHYIIGASGLALGIATNMIARPADSDVVIFLGTCLAVFFALKLSLSNRRSGSQETFQTENLVLWVAFAAGWTIVAGRVDENMLLTLTLPWFFSAVIGALGVSLKRAHLLNPLRLWPKA